MKPVLKQLEFEKLGYDRELTSYGRTRNLVVWMSWRMPTVYRNPILNTIGGVVYMDIRKHRFKKIEHR
jgi:hypothetical protein